MMNQFSLDEDGGAMARRTGFISPSIAQRAMRRLDLTTPAVAAHLDVGASTVRAWLAGTGVPSPDRLAAFARLLQVDIADLAGITRGEETLSELRIASGLTQQQAADMAGISQSALSAVETGTTRLTEKTRESLALAYLTRADLVEAAWQRSRDTLRS